MVKRRTLQRICAGFEAIIIGIVVGWILSIFLIVFDIF